MDITFLGLGLHIFIALFFAIHVVRTGQPMYWLILLFLFPLLASVVYFFAIYLPGFRLQHGARRVVAAATRALDPQRELRNARAAFEELPTAQNQMRLAESQLELGMPEEAAKNYDACLKGPMGNSLEIKFGAARSFVECQRHAEAITQLESIRGSDPAFRQEAVALLLARAYAGTGRQAEARSLFEATVSRFGTFEARAEFAIWALTSGDAATAARLQAEIDQITLRWNSHTAALHEPTLRRLKAATPLPEQHT